jgi:hypothetical protein
MNGLLPVRKNALQLKLDHGIGEFPHGEKRQLIIHLIFYQRCPIRFGEPMGVNPQGVIPSCAQRSKKSYCRAHLRVRPPVGGHIGPPLQKKKICYLYERNLVL